MPITRVQYNVAQTSDPTATFTAAPTEGNLLVASAFARSGLDMDAATISGSGWVKRVVREALPGDTTYRRELVAWTKVAGASEPSSVTATVGGTAALVIQEFTGASSWSFLDSVSNDNGGASDALSIASGTTASSTAGSQLLIGLVGVKGHSETAEQPWPTPSWTNGLGNTAGYVGTDGNQRTLLSAYAETHVAGTKSTTVSHGATNGQNFGLIGALLVFRVAGTAPVFDAFSTNAASGAQSFTHTPIGTPRGVLVLVADDNNHGSLGGVTYGGVNVPLVATVEGDWGIDSYNRAYFLGSGIPTGPQTVALVTPSATEQRRVGVVTVTAGGDTEFYDDVTSAAAGGAISGSVPLGGVAAFVAMVGVAASARSTSASGWSVHQTGLLGTSTHSFFATYNTVGTADVPLPAWGSASDHSAIGVAIRVASGGGSTDLAVGGDTHGHTSESPALTQSYVLVVPASRHGHTAEAPALQQANALIVGGDTHGHTAEEPSLSGATQLVVGGDAHGHTAEAPALTQANQLAVPGDSHGHTSEAPALTQAGTLAVPGDTHGHTAEAPALAQASTLAVGGDTHGHTAASPTLDQSTQLAPSAHQHGHTSESPPLTQASALQPAGGQHGHTADAPALSQAHALAVGGDTHGHTSGVPTLSTVLTLAVAPTLHAHRADSPALTQALTLVVQEVLHAHRVDSPTLVQAYVLAIMDVRHAHTSELVGLLEGPLVPLDVIELEVALARRLEEVVAIARQLEVEAQL